MNKTAIKNYAIWARTKLIENIKYKASLLGITEKGIADALPQSTPQEQYFAIGTRTPYAISGVQVTQRRSLAAAISQRAQNSDHSTAYNSIMEEVAYTWFNRFIAVRFMEVNDYLPCKVRVLSAEDGRQEPDIVQNPFDGKLDYTPAEEEAISQYQLNNESDKLFNLLFIKVCNDLSKVLPQLFEAEQDYTELLLHISYTDKDGLIYKLVHDIPEEDFNIEQGGQVEIIGWLYQYYNTEPKNETFALLKKNIKITKERIPSVTQLFTPDWIVRYMVENSLGRLWLEGHAENSALKGNWKYYLDEAQQEENVQAELAKIREEYAKLRPENIKVIDPCMGSGHILVYAFDILMQIYTQQGYAEKDAAIAILVNNLYGLDIDQRAFQLAYFAVLMKARQYHKFILKKQVQCHLYPIVESNGIKVEQLQYFGAQLDEFSKNAAAQEMQGLLDELRDAKEYGSIISVGNYNWPLLKQFVADFDISGEINLFNTVGLEKTQKRLQELVAVGEMLAQKYEVVVTNPPYMGASGMGAKLSAYVKKNYPDTKSDMSTVMMEKTLAMCTENGYMAMINIPVWMFLSSYEKLRNNILKNNSYVNMLHFGRGVFGSDFGTTAFVIGKKHIDDYVASYRRLFEKQGAVDSVDVKEQWFLEGKGKYVAKQENFAKIPGAPVAYWVSEKFIKAFDVGIGISEISDFTGSQHKTADNEKYTKFFWEISKIDIDKKMWIFYIKGGEYRKWYGNIDLVVDWRNEAKNFYKNNITSNMIKDKYCFSDGITYTSLTSAANGFRYLPAIGAFDIKGPSLVKVKYRSYCLGFFNSIVANKIMKLLNPTITLQVKDVKNTPIVFDYNRIELIEKVVDDNIILSKSDWDSFETSWDFKKHPLL